MKKFTVRTFESIEKVNENQWNNLVDQSQLGGFFQRSEWLEILEKGLELKPIYVIVEKDSNPVAVFPNFVEKVPKTPFDKLVSLPLGEGGFILNKTDREILDLLFDKLDDVCQNQGVMSYEINMSNFDYMKFSEYFSKRDFEPKRRGCHFTVDLNVPYEEIKERFHKDKRYDLRKADRDSVEIRDEKINVKNLKKFYEIYREVMKERLDVEPHPFSLFKRLPQLNESMKLFVASYKSRDVGGFIHFINDSEVHHFFGDVLNDYLKYGVTDLLHEFSIKWAIEESFHTYNLGGTTASFKSGVYKYKEQFGRPRPVLLWEKKYSELKNKVYNFGKNVYRKVRG